MVRENLHKREPDNTADLEHDRTTRVTTDPGRDAPKNDDEEPPERIVPEDGWTNERSSTEGRRYEDALN